MLTPDLEAEKKAVSDAVQIAKLMAEATERLDKENKRLWKTVVALILALCVMAGCMVYVSSNAQRIANEAVLSALETVAELEVVSETTTTTSTTNTTEVTQDTGEGSGNNVYLDGDGTTYNEGS